MYLWIFCTCDIISLVVQAVGGGMAATQSSKIGGDTSTGTNIMVAGIVFQLASITVFVALAVDFVCRCFRHRELVPRLLERDPRKSLRPAIVLFCATAFSIVCIYVRCIYRTIELAQGWDGYLIKRERFFVAMDGAMMVPCVINFNIFHPGWLLPPGAANLHHMHSKGKAPSDGDYDDPIPLSKPTDSFTVDYADKGKDATV